jgi:hypothetical protein
MSQLAHPMRYVGDGANQRRPSQRVTDYPGLEVRLSAHTTLTGDSCFKSSYINFGQRLAVV